jgi:hypothetical protein
MQGCLGCRRIEASDRRPVTRGGGDHRRNQAAQGRQFETPLYTTGTSSLDKNYGLPTFGMPGSELPQQKTMATKADPPAQPDFFAGASDLTVPRNRSAAAADPGMETPLYTTSQGMTDGYDTGSTTGSETSTPLFGTAALSFGTRSAR